MTAEFTIDDTAFSTLGYDAEHDQVVELALEDAPGLDAARVVFSVVLASDDALPLVFSPVTGIPATPTGTVTVTMPSTGVHSWRIQCQVNEGYDATGRINREFTKERIISVRSANLGLRKLVPGETTQYDVAGWTEEQNRAVDLLDTYGIGGDGFPFHDGIVFPTDANYRMIQEDAETGVAPGEANIQGQSAAAGDAEDGGVLRLAGGDPGDVSNLAGNVIVEVGPAIGDTTAALAVESLGVGLMHLMKSVGLAAIRAVGAMTLQMYSDTQVRMQASTAIAALTDSAFTLSFLDRFIMSKGQRQVVPALNGGGISGDLQIDFDQSEKYYYSISGDIVFLEPLNILEGATYTIRVQQDGTGGHTATWASLFKFGALNSTLSVAPNAVDIFVFEGSSSETLHCLIAAKGVHA